MTSCPPRQELSTLAPASHRDQDGLHPPLTCGLRRRGQRGSFLLSGRRGEAESKSRELGLAPDPGPARLRGPGSVPGGNALPLALCGGVGSTGPAHRPGCHNPRLGHTEGSLLMLKGPCVSLPAGPPLASPPPRSQNTHGHSRTPHGKHPGGHPAGDMPAPSHGWGWLLLVPVGGLSALGSRRTVQLRVGPTPWGSPERGTELWCFQVLP